jgi:hypothetical protein
MPYTTEISTEPDLLRITAEGVYDFRELFGFIEFIKTEADRAGRERVLVDCRKLNGKISDVDRFEGGQHIAKVFGPILKVALVMPDGEVTKLGELAAVNRGARFFVTDDEAEALRWLQY